jgi:hypothetical protein
MLFGYEDWQNDWWIKRGITGGGFGGMSCCCTVTAAGLAWIEATGFRALPPIDRPTLTILMHDWENEADQYAAMLGDPESVAVARFNMLGRDFMNFWASQRGGPDCRIQPLPPRIGRDCRAARRSTSLEAIGPYCRATVLGGHLPPIGPKSA